MKLSSCLRYQALYEITPGILAQPNATELPKFDIRVAWGPGQATVNARVFENPKVPGMRSVRIKNALSKHWGQDLKKTIIFE